MIINPTKEILAGLYSDPLASISSVAKSLGVSQPTVRKWLINYNIPRKSHQQASQAAATREHNIIDPKELTHLYIEQGMSIDQLEQHFSVGQMIILNAIDQLGIRKTLSNACVDAKEKQFADKQIDQLILEDILNQYQYVEDVAEALNISRGHLRTLMIRYNLNKHWTGKSRAQKQLFNRLNEIVDGWKYNDRTVIAPLELDIYHPHLQLAVEYCGLYWHGELSGKTRNYHQTKMRRCRDEGIRLITVFDHDNIEVIIRSIRQLVIPGPKIYARKCKIVQINSSAATLFHNANHIEKSVGGSIHLGLFDKDQLVMVASFAKSRYDTHYEYECMRVSSNQSVIGGTSKMFQHFYNMVESHSLCTYANMRFGQGDVYKHCGLIRVKDTNPNYKYVKGGKVFSRVQFQKHKLSNVLDTFDPTISEWENMKFNGYDRVWDCGHAKYVTSST